MSNRLAEASLLLLYLDVLYLTLTLRKSTTALSMFVYCILYHKYPLTASLINSHFFESLVTQAVNITTSYVIQ